MEQKRKIDVILTYYIVDSIFKPLDVPVIVYLGGFPRSEIKIYGAFLNFVNTVIYNSKNVRNAWGKQVLESNIKQEFVLDQAVDFLEREKIRNPFSKAKERDVLHIVFAGRLIERKGVHKLLELVSKLLKKDLKVKLWILGNGPEKSNLIHLSMKLNIEKNINFVGFVNNVYDYYYHSDLVILPSLFGEGLMGTVSEAMMCGATVISTKGVGNEEIIFNKETGFLYDSRDDCELFSITFDLLQNSEKRKRVGNNAQKFAQKNFRWGKVMRKINKILKLSLKKE